MRSVYSMKKSDAKRRGIDFNWTFEQFKQFCKDTGYMEKKGKGPDDYVIDRIRAWEGYQPDNVQLLTQKENSKKARYEPRQPPGHNDYPNTPF